MRDRFTALLLLLTLGACASAGTAQPLGGAGAGEGSGGQGDGQSGEGGHQGDGGAGKSAGMGGANGVAGQVGSSGGTTAGIAAGSGGEAATGGMATGAAGSGMAAGTAAGAAGVAAGGMAAGGMVGSGGAPTAGAGGSISGAFGGGTQSGGGVAAGGNVNELCGVVQEGKATVYAHSASQLYKIDADSKLLDVIGDFNCGSMIDIAVDKTGEIIGTTFGGIVKVDKATAKCQEIKSGDYPNSLSYVPEGTMFADQEALVGYNGDTYLLIDPVTGSVQEIGSLGGGYQSSGDIVSVKGGDTYLTVNGNGCGDCLVRIDPKTGALIENLGSVGKGSVYGLAYWAGMVYGFTSYGEMFSYDVQTKQHADVNIPNAPFLLSFYGAGSTTCAPVFRPK